MKAFSIAVVVAAVLTGCCRLSLLDATSFGQADLDLCKQIALREFAREAPQSLAFNRVLHVGAVTYRVHPDTTKRLSVVLWSTNNTDYVEYQFACSAESVGEFGFG